MGQEFALEVSPEPDEFEVDAVVDDNTFIVEEDEKIVRPGDDREIIRDRRQ